MSMPRAIVMVTALALCAPAQAERDGGGDLGWHAGLNLRAETGTHPIRIAGGVSSGALDGTLVIDPMFWTDGQHDIEVFGTYGLADGGWGGLFGWRTTAIGILGGTQLQQKLILGVGAKLPDVGPLRIHWHIELATLVVKHGADLPREWISFATGRDFIDLLNFGMFLTVEYAR
jgi:hypothetical protein